MNVLDIVNEILYPSNFLGGTILSIIFSSVVLFLCRKAYKKEYTFTTKEKTTSFILSFLFMLTGSVISQGTIPIIVWGLLAFHFMVDHKYMELPDGVNLWIAGLSIFSIVPQWIEQGFLQSGIITGVILFGLFLLLAFIGPMGGGDIKMMGAAGLYFTLWDIPSLIMYGFSIGAIHGIVMMVIKRLKKNMMFAFGPALIFGIWLVTCIKGGMFYV